VTKQSCRPRGRGGSTPCHAAPPPCRAPPRRGRRARPDRHEEVREGGQEELGEAPASRSHRLGHRQGRAVVDHRLLGVTDTRKERHDLGGREAPSLRDKPTTLTGALHAQLSAEAGRRRVRAPGAGGDGALTAVVAEAMRRSAGPQGGEGASPIWSTTRRPGTPDHDRAHAGRLTTGQAVRVPCGAGLDLPRGARTHQASRIYVLSCFGRRVWRGPLAHCAARLRDLDRQVRKMRLIQP